MEITDNKNQADALSLLIIEDDAVTANIYRSRFEREGYRVEICADGQTGFYRLHEVNFSVLLLDLMLPNMSGIDIVRKLRAQKRFDRMPVFILTNSHLNRLIQEATTAGVTQIFFKSSSTPNSVVAAVHNYLTGTTVVAPPMQAAHPTGGFPTAPMQPPQTPAPPSEISGIAASAPLPSLLKNSAHPGFSPSPLQVKPMAPMISDITGVSQPSTTPPTILTPKPVGSDSISWTKPTPAPLAPQAKPAASGPKAPEGEMDLSSFYPKTEQQINVMRGALKALHSLVPKTPDAKIGESQSKEILAHLQTIMKINNAIVVVGGMFGLKALPRVAESLEALAWDIQENTSLLTASILTTMAKCMDLLAHLTSSYAEISENLSGSVLVVDDDMFSRRAAVMALKKVGIKPMEMDNPVAAFEQLQKTPFDLVITDVNMPGMNGFELCKKLRELPANSKTPVIFITVDGNFERKAQSVLSGGSGFIVKPYTLMELAVKALGYVVQKHAIVPSAAPEESLHEKNRWDIRSQR